MNTNCSSKESLEKLVDANVIARLDLEELRDLLLGALKASLELLNRIPLVAVEANTGADICQARRELAELITKAEGK